jgi:hypothetical protein
VKPFLNTIVALENAGAIAAALAIAWLSSRYHWMTGPQQLVTINEVQVMALICSFSALGMGLLSFIALRAFKSGGYEGLGARGIWATLSLVVSAILAFLSLLPTRVG